MQELALRVAPAAAHPTTGTGTKTRSRPAPGPRLQAPLPRGQLPRPVQPPHEPLWLAVAALGGGEPQEGGWVTVSRRGAVKADTGGGLEQEAPVQGGGRGGERGQLVPGNLLQPPGERPAVESVLQRPPGRDVPQLSVPGQRLPEVS